MARINLCIHKRTKKIHVGTHNDQALCGTYVSQEMAQFGFDAAKTYGRPSDWCKGCVQSIMTGMLTHDQSKFTAVIAHILNLPANKHKEEPIDAIRTEIIFDDESMKIKMIAGRSTGARDSIAVGVRHKIEFDWSRLESIRDIVSEDSASHVTFAFHSAKEV